MIAGFIAVIAITFCWIIAFGNEGHFKDEI